MKNAPRYRFGGAGFLELERGYQPWVIPKSEARGGAGHAVKKEEKERMDERICGGGTGRDAAITCPLEAPRSNDLENNKSENSILTETAYLPFDKKTL
ncbi:hypothetical protein OsI_16863 [Oryza sativa Indica Group]|uniref:Uncharacterized protein n=1 Tax=Oryza sativa subsp. indica TaxID=39946 RepID=B8ASN6_ORYSI|nr:hypothetical protein OsI_16863 [Oryza sativa Indica Group]